MKHTKLAAAVFASLVMAGTSTIATSALAASSQNSAVQHIETAKSAELEKLFNDYNREFVALNPINATLQGNADFNDQFGEYYTEEYLQKSRALSRKYHKLIMAIDPVKLNIQDNISYRIFLSDRERELESFNNNVDRTNAMMPINQFISFAAYLPMFGSGRSIQPFRTVQDYENWVARVNGFPKHVDQAIAQMRKGIKAGVVLPTVLAEKVLPQLKAHLVDDYRNSAFYMPIGVMPDTFSDVDKVRLEALYKEMVETTIIPTYARYAEFFEREYLPNTRATHGLSGIPNGDAVYADAIKTFTSTDMTADEIHQIGLAQGKRLYAEMERVKEKVGFEGSMQDFFAHLNSDPKFFYSKPEELLAGYEDIRHLINPKLDGIFKAKPKADYVIVPIEAFRAQSGPAAQYIPGAPDGSRPGIFYVNTSNLDSRPKWLMNALSIHEASPGHHFQISLNSENTGLPPFRQFSNYTAFTEGWGLYSETLGMEMGVYDDPYQYFGMLHLQIWRANRLVVDTGLHAKGWTREQAIEYMRSNSPAAEHEIVAEVERYMALPGQALAYMVGKLKIDELRALAVSELKDNFSLADFHHQVLVDGSMPLAVLETKIKDWIKTQKAKSA